MKKRQLIIIAITIAILVLGKLLSNALAQPKEKKMKVPSIQTTIVFTQQVKNDSVSIDVDATGVLKAVKRMELFSEVQGVMEADNGRFKAGNAFKKGEILLAIRSSDQQAQLYAQRSSFQSSLNAIMPDLKIDYPNEVGAWEQYLKSYPSTSMLKELPEATSGKLNAFLVGRGIYSNYHSLKSLEIVNSKYQIRAPYDGVLISTQADPGTVIRPGQALAVFIQPQFYEMETAIDAVSAGHLKIGQTVALKMQGLEDKIWKGKIARLVKAIDPNSQMSTFFVAVNGTDLKEGMFMQAKVAANHIIDAYEISRSSLVENSKVYVVQADTLVLKAIKKEHVSQHTVVISGLKEGAEVLTKIPPSAFPGMKVSIYKAQH